MSTELLTLAGATMGTRYAVQIPADTVANTAQLRLDLHDAVTSVDQQMSPWIPSSNVNAFNAAPVGDWIDLPDHTANVIKMAIQIEDESHAAFSIAVAPQVRHYGFSTRPRNNGPAPMLDCWAYDAIDLADRKIRKTRPIEIDLCGIAKGYGVDVLAETLLSHDIQNFMVTIDGELRCQGAPATGQTWRVAIEEPVQDVRYAACVLPCADLALATSGGYRHFDVSGPQTVTHTINPRNGQPLSEISRSVVMAHTQCCAADAWATALLVMSPAEAEKTIKTHGLNALLLWRNIDRTVSTGHGIFATTRQSA